VNQRWVALPYVPHYEPETASVVCACIYELTNLRDGWMGKSNESTVKGTYRCENSLSIRNRRSSPQGLCKSWDRRRSVRRLPASAIAHHVIDRTGLALRARYT
jgi:hypothetical protein